MLVRNRRNPTKIPKFIYVSPRQRSDDNFGACILQRLPHHCISRNRVYAVLATPSRWILGQVASKEAQEQRTPPPKLVSNTQPPLLRSSEWASTKILPWRSLDTNKRSSPASTSIIGTGRFRIEWRVTSINLGLGWSTKSMTTTPKESRTKALPWEKMALRNG